MDSLKSMSPCGLVVLGALLTFLISDDSDAGDLNVLGNLIVSVGSLVLTWAAQKELQEKPNNANNSNDDSIAEIKSQIKILQDKCNKLERLSSMK